MNAKSKTVHKVQLYGICIVSLLNVIGNVRLLEHSSSHASPTRIIAGPLCSERSNDTRRTTVSASGSRYHEPKALRHRKRALRKNTLLDTALREADLGWGLYPLALNHDDDADVQRSLSEAKLSPPQGIFLDYMRRHSAHSLRQESPEELQKRQFAIAYYSCPHQLGNRIFHFMNNVLWAIITNRTILYKYLDQYACEQLKQVQPMLYLDNVICRAANTVQDCDEVMERASWLPSYDEFFDPAWEIHIVDFWQTHWFRSSSPWIRNRFPFDESKHTNMTKVDRIESKIVEFSALTNADTVALGSRSTRHELLDTPNARIRARKLAKNGLRFAYGMFFSEMFRLRNEQVDIVRDYYPKPNDGDDDDDVSNTFSIALHSRHKHVKQTGSYIENEKHCLNDVLVNRQANQSCVVCAMSDRPLALTTLKAWLKQEHQCELIHIQHSVSATSFSVEHGPHAGVGFVRELDVCHRYGSHAVVTTSGASSSALLEALVDYNNNNQNGKYDNVRDRQVVTTQYCSRKIKDSFRLKTQTQNEVRSQNRIGSFKGQNIPIVESY